jgi:branched-chain amino acid transport system substrate-binding protein
LTDLEGPASDESPGRLWRTAAPDAFQARVIAGDLTMRGVTSVAVIAEDGAYGLGLADELEAEFGGTVTRHVFANASARNTAATEAGSSTAEEVLFFSSQTSDASALVLFAASFAGYDTKQLFFSDSAGNMDFLTDAASASAIFDRIRGTRPAAPGGTVFTAFVGAYAAENGGADVTLFSFTAQSYDAAWLALLGATWAQTQEGGELSAPNIARGLRMLNAGTPFDVGAASYPGIADRFRLGESVDLTGASGNLSYDPVSEETSAPIEIWRIAATGDAFEQIRVETPGP